MDDIVVFVRWANVVLGTVAFFWLAARTITRRKTVPPEVMLFLYVIGFFVLGGVEVSAEAIADEQEAGPRSFIFLMGNLGTLIALVITQSHRRLTIDSV